MIVGESALGSKPSLTDSGIADPKGSSSSGPRNMDMVRHVSPIITAVMVDAGFFMKRARQLFGALTPKATAEKLHCLALDHLNDNKGLRISRLYKIFVYDAPPAKLARREGIDFILDPLWATIRPALYEHVDGLRTVCPKPEKRST